MHLILDGRGALHAQLTRSLKHAIQSGALANGTRLPPTRSLAGALQLSRNTVMAAYEQLQAEGILEARVGHGTFVVHAAGPAPSPLVDTAPAQPQSKFAHRARTFHDPARAPQGAAALRPPRYSFQYGSPLVNPTLTSAWAREIARAAEYTPLHYPDPQGLLRLREAVVDYLARRRGVHASVEDVLVVHGTQQSISIAARVLLDEGDQAAIEEPQYVAIRKVLQIHGARLAPVPVDADGMRVDLLPQRPPKLVCVTPSHQFPTGSVLSADRRAALLDYADRHQCWIFEDDYDGEFRYDRRPLPALRAMDAHDRVIYTGTFSKLLFPSLRLGFLVMPRSLRRDFIAAKWAQDLGTSAIEQAALANFMSSGAFDRHLRHAFKELAERRSALLGGLQACGADRLEVSDSHAGMHIVAWMRGISHAGGEAFLKDAACAGLGLHSIRRHYMAPPDRFGLLLGFCGISVPQIRDAMPLLAGCVRRAHGG